MSSYDDWGMFKAKETSANREHGKSNLNIPEVPGSSDWSNDLFGGEERKRVHFAMTIGQVD